MESTRPMMHAQVRESPGIIVRKMVVTVKSCTGMYTKPISR